MDGEEEREFDALLEELRKTDLEENTDQNEQQIDVDTHPFAKEWSTLLDDPMKLIDVDLESILGLEGKNFLHKTVGAIRSEGNFFWIGVIFAGLAEAKDIEGLLPEDVLSQHLAKLYPNHKVEGGPCRAVVNDDRFVYRCLDCMKNQGALMCPGCYDKDRHENHL